MTFVQFLSTVNSAVSNKVSWVCKSFATNSTFKWLLSRMTSSVYCWVTVSSTTLSTFSALVLTAVSIHMLPQIMWSSKVFLTLSTCIHLISSMTLLVTTQTLFCCKSFVTHRTHIRSWLVIMWMLSCIITISFNLHFNWTFTCITQHNSDKMKARCSCYQQLAVH